MLESFPFTGCVFGQMLPFGSTHGGSVFLAGAFFAATFFAGVFFAAGTGAGAVSMVGSGSACRGSSPTVINPGSSDATIGSTSGSGTCTGVGVATAASSGGQARGVAPSADPGEPKSRTEE